MSNNTNGNTPAYPTRPEQTPNLNGLTKREAFAMAAMQGLISQANSNEEASDKYTVNGGWVHAETIGLTAVQCADELLKALEK